MAKQDEYVDERAELLSLLATDGTFIKYIYGCMNIYKKLKSELDERSMLEFMVDLADLQERYIE